MSARLEREVKIKLELAESALTGGQPAPDYGLYREMFARHQVLRELQDFIEDSQKAGEAGDTIDDD